MISAVFSQQPLAKWLWHSLIIFAWISCYIRLSNFDPYSFIHLLYLLVWYFYIKSSFPFQKNDVFILIFQISNLTCLGFYFISLIFLFVSLLFLTKNFGLYLFYPISNYFFFHFYWSIWFSISFRCNRVIQNFYRLHSNYWWFFLFNFLLPIEHQKLTF